MLKFLGSFFDKRVPTCAALDAEVADVGRVSVGGGSRSEE
jgi:hypothetical protein